MQRNIPELLEDLASSDIRTAGLAGRELIKRADECTPYIEPIVDFLSFPNYAIVEFARITIERMGEQCMPTMLARYEHTAGEVRIRYLGLIAFYVDMPTFLELLPREMRNGDLETCYYAARCLIYRLYSKTEMDEVAVALIQESVELLQTTRADPTRDDHWAHARMALKHCGALPADEPWLPRYK